jgi:hypothetical protein
MPSILQLRDTPLYMINGSRLTGHGLRQLGRLIRRRVIFLSPDDPQFAFMPRRYLG